MNFMVVQKFLQTQANPEKAKILQRFFKTGKGEYGDIEKFSESARKRYLRQVDFKFLFEYTLYLNIRYK